MLANTSPLLSADARRRRRRERVRWSLVAGGWDGYQAMQGRYAQWLAGASCTGITMTTAGEKRSQCLDRYRIII